MRLRVLSAVAPFGHDADRHSVSVLVTDDVQLPIPRYRSLTFCT